MKRKNKGVSLKRRDPDKFDRVIHVRALLAADKKSHVIYGADTPSKKAATDGELVAMFLEQTDWTFEPHEALTVIEFSIRMGSRSIPHIRIDNIATTRRLSRKSMKKA